MRSNARMCFVEVKCNQSLHPLRLLRGRKNHDVLGHLSEGRKGKGLDCGLLPPFGALTSPQFWLHTCGQQAGRVASATSYR